MRPPKIAILLACIGFAGWVFFALYSAEPVRVLDTTLQHEGGEVFVQGKVQNSGPDTGPIDIEIRYFDDQGRTVGQDKIVVEMLRKGLIAPFQTPKRTIKGADRFSLYVNHGRNPYGN